MSTGRFCHADHATIDMIRLIERLVANGHAYAAEGHVLFAVGTMPDYGRLSVMLQTRLRVVPLFEIGPGAFRPPPKVDSAIVRFVPLERPRVPAGLETVFAEVVRLAFAQRRKQLRPALCQQ